MVTHLVKHITQSEGTSPNRVLVARAVGAIGGKVKPVRTYAELKYVYNIDACNGDDIISVSSSFPSGKYDALDFVPTRGGHRFIGWFSNADEPSAAIPNMDGELTSDLPVVCSVKTVYAHWQLPTAVTFDAISNGGVMPDGWSAPDYYAGQPYGELPKPSHESLNFTGWYDGNGNRITSASIVPEGGDILVARYAAQSYTVNLNDEWRLEEGLNPDSNAYDGVYQSFGNTGFEDEENWSESMAKMYIDVVGYTNFRIYLASNSESNYDYVVAMEPDVDPEEVPSAWWDWDDETQEDVLIKSEGVKEAVFENTFADPSFLEDYTPVDYELDGGAHRICIVYRKDSSVNEGEDCGYVLIPKE